MRNARRSGARHGPGLRSAWNMYALRWCAGSIAPVPAQAVPGILERWNAEWRHSLKIQKISAQEYVRLDPQTRLCPR